MVKTSKTSSTASSVELTATPTSTSTVTATVSDTVSATVSDAAPKRLPKPKSAASAAPVEPTLTASAPENIVTSGNVSAPVSSHEPSPLLSMYAEYSSKLQAAHATWTTLRSEFRLLERQTARELKNAQKASQKKKRKVGNRAPSGFVKPTLISNELAGFLGKPEGSEMARTDVTREINKYIRTNNLQDKENGRKIIPDKKLTSLLKLKKGDELTYFNLQRYMSPHFAKASAAAVAVSDTVVASSSS
jgi:hypothetical protein